MWPNVEWNINTFDATMDEGQKGDDRDTDFVKRSVENWKMSDFPVSDSSQLFRFSSSEFF